MKQNQFEAQILIPAPASKDAARILAWFTEQGLKAPPLLAGHAATIRFQVGEDGSLRPISVFVHGRRYALKKSR